MKKRLPILTFLMLCLNLNLLAQTITMAGRVTDEESGAPIEYASILMNANGFWAITNSNGEFAIKNVPVGKTVLIIQSLGYAKRELVMNITRDMPRMRLTLKQESLKLDEVTVTAKRKTDEATTSYTIDRTTLDNQQLINVGDITTLMPGGKTINPTLMNDNRIALRSGTAERGNASFGTAIEVDGIRLNNNGEMGETAGASTRTLSTSNIESVEVVTGIPSVEYGDLSNGVVKVNTRKGKSPFIVEGKINQHTWMLAVNKGFELGKQRGVVNASLERAVSHSNIASPHTAYQRNTLTLNYMNILMRNTTPLTLNIGLTGNIGGYNSEADPDNELDDYNKIRDNAIRAHFDLNWLLNKSWITNLSLRGSLAYSDKLTKNYTHASSASTQPYIHTTEQGYFMAQEYGQGEQDIILSPTGYWHVMQLQDSKPLNYSLRLKGDWTHRFGKVMSRLMAGAEWTGSKNHGRGTYYEDMRYAPTWREYRYDELPAMLSRQMVNAGNNSGTARRHHHDQRVGLRYGEQSLAACECALHPVAEQAPPVGDRPDGTRRMGKEREAALVPSAVPGTVVQRPAGIQLAQHEHQHVVLCLSHLPLEGGVQPRPEMAIHQPDGPGRGDEHQGHPRVAVGLPPPYIQPVHGDAPIHALQLPVHPTLVVGRTGHRPGEPPVQH